MAASLSSNTMDEQLDNDAQKAIVAATRLWHQTRQMKTTILEKCRLYLKNTDTDVQVNIFKHEFLKEKCPFRFLRMLCQLSLYLVTKQ